MSLYQVGTIWYIYAVHKGKRIRQSTGTSDKEAAQRIHDEFKAELWRRRECGSHLSDALVRWLKHKDRSRNEKNAIKHFLTLYPDRPITEITGQDIADALADKTPANAKRTVSIIRAALALECRAVGLPVPHIPLRPVKSTRLRWLTREEWGRLYLALPLHLKPMAKFAVSTGLRQSNVFELTWQQVDLERRTAWVDATESKSGRAIGIPLSDDAMEALRSVQGQHPSRVFTYRGKPVSSVKTAFNKALERAGLGDYEGEGDARHFVPNLVWHDLRHTWASWHVQRGTPLSVLKELGGWATMDMVMRYAHLAPDHLAEWANNTASTP